MRMMKELTGSNEEKGEGEELCRTHCKKERHIENTCPRKAFCDICQVLGHSIKDCPYNLKARNAHIFLTQGEPSTPPPPPCNTNMGASSGGYNSKGSNNNNTKNTPRSKIQYDITI